MDIAKLYQQLYSVGNNQGMAEGYIDPENLMIGGNVSNTTYLPSGLLSVAGGANVEPTADKVVNPFIEMLYRDNNGLEAKAAMDNYAKSIGAGYGNNAGNAYANVTDAGYGNEFNLGAMLNNILGGTVSADAYKNPYDKGLMFNFTKSF